MKNTILKTSSSKVYTCNLIYQSSIHSYGFDVSRHYSARLKLNLLLKYVQNTSKVLDAGCANGLFSFAISNLCKEVYGIDINEQFLKIAQEKAQEEKKNNLNFIFGDLEEIPFEEEFFDCLFSYSCLVLVEDFFKTLKECARVVKKNGYLLLDITGKYNLSKNFWKNYYISNGHYSFNTFSYSEIKNFCSLNRLKILEIHALGVLDQWKYLPLIPRFRSKFSWIGNLFHFKSFNLDYILSNLPFLKNFANRWYLVCQKI
ncbi:class I SAM-dependent methyltransferase [Holospora undulata]|uniref:Putative methyltransferase C1B3.06c n=1 Tax=Holospora undulata HU1 TaxID=1321371 RepID=A0A061JFP3_9PROT|nr:class I SAM-dependent methyltransferase [Holospora undulata]ETZ04415.1 putative methyltransferase C1B3.06c [Holospora undulata HU1]ETZ04465.1 putative methyltransferase C1B3.06c [Holospora undulata HU1]ETZ04492.1 putative methyltransferase C1B3.06c [Holospora undulata HU1]